MFYILLLLSLVLIFIIFIFKNINRYKLKFYKCNKINKLKFYKCNKIKLSPLIKEIFNEYKLERTYDKNYDIFLPCNYTYIKNEMKQFKKCNNKLIFGIINCDKIVSKSNLWYLLEKTYSRKNAKKIMPESYLLRNKNDMILFNKEFNSDELYLLKKNIQQKRGISITQDIKIINNAYKDKFVIVQKYLKNQYLYNNRKLNLRIYVLVIIKNKNKQVFINKKGKCIYSNKDFEINNLNPEIHLTSYNLDQNIYKNFPETFEELNYQLKDNKFSNIFNKIIKICKLVFKPSLQYISDEKFNNCICFQLFGLDFILDNDFNPFLLEINKGPDMIPKSKKDKVLKKNIYYDVFSKVNIIQRHSNNFLRIL